MQAHGELDRRIFRGRFRLAYLGVKALGVYAGCFIVCFYWPLFLESALVPPASPRTELAAALVLAPLGLVVVGAFGGWRSALAHAAIVLAAAASLCGLMPRDGWGDPTLVVSRWLPVLAAAYALGWGIGWREQLRRFAAVA
jgi:hypothetical protein